MTPKAYILPKKTLKQGLKDIWIQFLAEIIRPFMKDSTVRMSFTRQLNFFGKVRTLSSQAWSKV